MAGSKFIPCIGPSYPLEDKWAGIQDAINCYPKKVDADKWFQESIPGEQTIATVTGECRGFKDVNGRFFGVYGNTLYEVPAMTVRGTLSSSVSPVGMAFNATQLAIVDGPNLYIFNTLTNAFVTISSAGWRGSDNVVFVDGYFVFADPDTEQFYISAIDDGTDLDALDFSSADTQPDNIIRHLVSHRQLWLFGRDSTEIWINNGGADFPFSRYDSYSLDVGCVGKYAAINAADTVVWIGRTPRGGYSVYIANGNQPQRISNVAVEEALRTSTDIGQATMWCYQGNGHEFVGITAPGLDTTWVYDAASSQWHQEAEWDGGWTPKQAQFLTSFNDSIYAGSSSGAVIVLDKALNQLSGRHLVRQRTWPHLRNDALEPTQYRGVEALVKTGNGGQISLHISNDGGFTWPLEYTRSLGVTGRWTQRVRWLGLGSSAHRVFRIRQTDNVPFGLYQVAVDA